MSEREDVEALLGRHLPKDRYGADGENVGTYCTGCDWEGDYFADGEAGPFDGHLADVILASSWLAAHVEAVRVSERVRLAGEVEALARVREYRDVLARSDLTYRERHARSPKIAVATVVDRIGQALVGPAALVPAPGVRLTEEE